MKEMKFRVWLKDKQVMEKVRSIEWAGIAVSSGFIKNIDTISDRYYSKDYNGTENYILMQYTGLEDENEVEIFEGDIVKETKVYDYSDDVDVNIYQIIWNENVTGFTAEGKNGSNTIHQNNMGVCEVIGNIYENPELLERENK
jgi:uncharacterized phage protein (TIGR01671 family)